MAKPIIPVTIRFPVELHEALVVAADEDMRSLNAEMVYLLAEALEARRREKEEKQSRR